jgi:hypothetical protein
MGGSDQAKKYIVIMAYTGIIPRTSGSINVLGKDLEKLKF